MGMETYTKISSFRTSHSSLGSDVDTCDNYKWQAYCPKQEQGSHQDGKAGHWKIDLTSGYNKI